MRHSLPDDALDTIDRRIINLLQEGLPLVAEPFAPVAAELGLSVEALLTRLSHLRELQAITRFGPFIDAAALGGGFCLCAMAVPQERFEAVVTLVNAHPEVAHNYERDHALNMWFVLACEAQPQIQSIAAEIEAETGLNVHLFPKLAEFFIGFKVVL